MKKIISVIVIIGILLTFTSCKKNSTENINPTETIKESESETQSNSDTFFDYTPEEAYDVLETNLNYTIDVSEEFYSSFIIKSFVDASKSLIGNDSSLFENADGWVYNSESNFFQKQYDNFLGGKNYFYDTTYSNNASVFVSDNKVTGLSTFFGTTVDYASAVVFCEFLYDAIEEIYDEPMSISSLNLELMISNLKSNTPKNQFDEIIKMLILDGYDTGNVYSLWRLYSSDNTVEYNLKLELYKVYEEYYITCSVEKL